MPAFVVVKKSWLIVHFGIKFCHCISAAIIINWYDKDGIIPIKLRLSSYFKSSCSGIIKSFIIRKHCFNFQLINLGVKQVYYIQVFKCNGYNMYVTYKLKPYRLCMKMHTCSKANNTIWFFQMVVLNK